MTSCSGLISSIDRQGALAEQRRMDQVFGGAHARSCRCGNSVQAVWHATMLVSSLLVTAMIMSASSAPARCNTRDATAWPCTVRISRRSCRSRSRPGSWSHHGDVVGLVGQVVGHGGTHLPGTG